MVIEEAAKTFKAHLGGPNTYQGLLSSEKLLLLEEK